MAAYSMKPWGIMNATDVVRVTRYWWDPSNDQFVLQPGFPTTVHDGPASQVAITTSTVNGIVDGAIVSWHVTGKSPASEHVFQQGVTVNGGLFWSSPAFAAGVPVDPTDLGTAAGGFQPTSVVSTNDGMAMVTYQRIVGGVPQHWTAKVRRPIAGSSVLYDLAPQAVPGQVQAGQPTPSTSRCCVAHDGNGGACFGFATEYTNTQLIASRLSSSGTPSVIPFWNSSAGGGSGGTTSMLRALSLVSLPGSGVLLTYRDLTGIRCIRFDALAGLTQAWTRFVRGASLSSWEIDDAASALHGDTVCILTTSSEEVRAIGFRASNGADAWNPNDVLVNDPSNPSIEFWRGNPKAPHVYGLSGTPSGWLLDWHDGIPETSDGAWLAERLGRSGKIGKGIIAPFDPISASHLLNSALVFNVHINDTTRFDLFEIVLGEPTGTPGSVEIYAAVGNSFVGIEHNPSAWTLMSSTGVVSSGPGHTTTVAMSSPLVLPAGTSALMLRGVSVSPGSVPAVGSGLHLDDGDLHVECGAHIATWPTGTATQGRLLQGGFYYSGAALPQTPGAVVPYGAGCYARTDSVYAQFADAATATPTLSGQSMRFAYLGNEYLATWSGGTFVAPSLGATVLSGFQPNSDDGVVEITLPTPLPVPGGMATSLHVHSNGSIWFDDNLPALLPNDYTPTPTALLAAPATGFWSWHDYNLEEPGSGHVYYEVVGSLACVTWLDVESYPAGVHNRSTLQFQFDLFTGDVTMVWPVIDANSSSPFGSGHLIGYSPGGGSIDGGSIDLATTLPTLTGVGMFPLQLTASTRPTSGVPITLTTSNVPEFLPGSGITIGIQLLSTSFLGGLDLGVLGAPGCLLHVATLDVMLTMISTTPTLSTTFAIPPGVPAGIQFYGQSVGLGAAGSLNAGGLVTSNGLMLRIGN